MDTDRRFRPSGDSVWNTLEPEQHATKTSLFTDRSLDSHSVCVTDDRKDECGTDDNTSDDKPAIQ